MTNVETGLKDKNKMEKEEISPEELADFFKKRLPNFTVSCKDCRVIIEKTFDDIDYEIKFLPVYSMRTKVSITNQWPTSREELKRIRNRDIKAICSFSNLEENPNYELSLPLDENDFRNFLRDLDRCKSEIESLFDSLASDIRQAMVKIAKMESKKGEEDDDD
jgi:hypothetical protein